jgi:hypothetical protein
MGSFRQVVEKRQADGRQDWGGGADMESWECELRLDRSLNDVDLRYRILLSPTSVLDSFLNF